MRILIVIPTVFGGGAEQVAAILSREWSAAHQVRVLAWQQSGESLAFGVPVNFAGLGVQPGLWRKFRNVWRRVSRLLRELRQFQPHAIMAFMDEAGVPCVMASALGGTLPRLIVSVHHNPQWLPRWRRMLLGCFYRFAGAIVAVSEGVRSELQQTLRLPASRLRHIPNPFVAGPTLQDDVSAKLAAHAARRFPQGYVLVVGRLDRYTKGFDVLIEAYASLPLPRPGLVIVGEGPDRVAIEEDAARAGIADDVLITGWVKDPRPFYRGASLFVLASRYEGWSNVLMEAMGEGCIVLATRCRFGPPEILGEALSRCLVASEDVAELARGMRNALLMNVTERVELSAALRRRVACFAASRVAQCWIDLVTAMQGADQ